MQQRGVPDTIEIVTAAKRHTDRAYEQELQTVRENLLRMAGYVENMIANSVKALIDGDRKLAEDTVGTDRKVNRLEVDTDELCLLILAKRQPLATDLRFITLAMKMVTDLERVGDLAVNICERGRRLTGVESAALADKIARMGTLVESMLHDAIGAFINNDCALAVEVIARDETIDDLYLQACEDIQDVMRKDTTFVSRGTHHQAVVKFLERIGDHATNLAELVVFMVKGKDVRHPGKLGPSR